MCRVGGHDSLFQIAASMNCGICISGRAHDCVTGSAQGVKGGCCLLVCVIRLAPNAALLTASTVCSQTKKPIQ